MNHLIALFGLWFGIYAVIYQAALWLGVPLAWLLIVALAMIYLAFVPSMPDAVTLATAVFLAFFVASVLALLPSDLVDRFVRIVRAHFLQGSSDRAQDLDDGRRHVGI